MNGILILFQRINLHIVGRRNFLTDEQKEGIIRDHRLFGGDPYLAHEKGLGYSPPVYEKYWKEAGKKLKPRDERLPAVRKRKYSLCRVV